MNLDKLQILSKKIEEAMSLLKLPDLKIKAQQLEEQMNVTDFWTDQKRAQNISQDYQNIKSEVEKWEEIKKQASDLLELAQSGDESLEKEIDLQTSQLEKKFQDYELFLLLNGPYDDNNAIIAIHAGSGGTEAQDWTQMLTRMYLRFAESKHWQVTVLSESRAEDVGLKSITLRVQGRWAYGYLKSEAGVHRLVRISPFDAEKMRHTTFALVEVIPELEDVTEIEIDPKDLRIDTFLSGGKGGQSVNTTYSAVRIVHLPTNIAVVCQNERSQLQNKETAMKILKSKLHQIQLKEQEQKKAQLRGEYQSAEWGNQIRSYVLHPYKLVKDHRTDYETTDAEGVLEGALEPFIYKEATCTTKKGPDNGIDGIFFLNGETIKNHSHIVINEAKFRSNQVNLLLNDFGFVTGGIQQSHSNWNRPRFSWASCLPQLSYDKETIIRTATLLDRDGTLKLYEVRDKGSKGTIVGEFASEAPITWNIRKAYYEHFN